MIVASDALSNLLDVWDEYTVADLGPHLTCAEADALADLFRVIGAPNMAEALIEGHAAEDDEGDLHYQRDDLCPTCREAEHDSCPLVEGCSCCADVIERREYQ